MEITPETDAIAGYVRLSRAELSEIGTFEEKCQRHKRILLRLAEAHHIPLADEQIVVEIKSGEKLATRPGLLGLLERAQSGQLKVLVAMAVDRLTRSVVDQAPIADAFFAGEVCLVTQEAKTTFDQKLDVTPWQMKALIAEWERERYSFRRKIHNEERASRGERSSGYAPYGYRWLKAALSGDGRSIVRPGHYEIIDAEYEIVKEIFTRILHQGMNVILRDLNQRYRETGWPAPPGHGRREDVAAVWHCSGLYRILTNPHYAGFPAHRQAMHRGKGRTKLPLRDWVFASTEQEYPHPLAGLEAWYELQALLASRRPKYGGVGRTGVLTRLLKCSMGRPMHSGGSGQYMCDCRERAAPHPGLFLKAERAEAVALRALQEAFAALPLDALPSVQVDPDRKTLTRERIRILQERTAQEHLANELMKNASLLISLYGEDDFRDKAEANKRALDAARRRLQEVETLLAQPDLREKRALLQRIATIGGGDIRTGTARLWEVADTSQRREMLQHVIVDMQMQPASASRKRCRHIKVLLTPFYATYYMPPVFTIANLMPTRNGYQDSEDENARHCTFCGAVVKKAPSENTATEVFCDRNCYSASRAKRATGPATTTCQCDFCGTGFERRTAYVKRRKQQFCNRECFKAWKAGKPLAYSLPDRKEDEVDGGE